MQSLGLSNTYGVAINSKGQIVGETASVSGGQVGQAFIWDPTTGVHWIPLLASLPGCFLTNGNALNDSSTVVGYCQSHTNSIQAFVWDNIHGAQALAPGSLESLAWSINNKGQIAGSIVVGLGVGRAVKWAGPGSMQLLALISDPQGNVLNTDAYSINDQGDIVGIAVGGIQNAALWIGLSGYLLDDLIPAASGWHLVQANGINNKGQIAGYGVIDGQTHGFRLDPVTDTTPPIIVPQITGILGTNGWYRSNVTVTWSVTDPESGIASSNGCNTASLTTDTPGVTLTCSATDGAALSSSASVTVKIHGTPPVISGMPSAGCSLSPPNHKLIQVATVTATDGLAGIVPGSFKVTAIRNDPTNGAIVITGGPSRFTVQLEADKGQIYTITATVSDLAGNVAAQQATCSVPHDQGK
jgi:hypothetical protein